MSYHVPPKNLRRSSAGFFLVLLTCLSLVTGLLAYQRLSACQQFATSQPKAATFSPPAASASSPPLPSITALPSHTLTPSSSPTRPFSPTAPHLATATISITPSVTPTYAILRGKVLVRSNCRYGPGADYLYYVGLRPGTTMNVIGRNDLGTWVLIQGVGDDRYCWIKASLMEIDGDVMAVQPTTVPLPLSPYYRPPTGVTAMREGDQVTIQLARVSPAPGRRDRFTPIPSRSLGVPG